MTDKTGFLFTCDLRVWGIGVFAGVSLLPGISLMIGPLTFGFDWKRSGGMGRCLAKALKPYLARGGE